MGTRLLAMFALLGSVLLVTVIGIRLVMSVFAYMRGDVGAIKRAGEAAFNAAIGFFIVFAVGGGIFLVLLKTLGTKPEFLKLLEMFTSTFVETAHAQEKLLPNPLGSNSAYDIILAALNLAMRFFIYPGLIAMWVASGFKFIYSQGNPEGLKTARNWLFISFIVTIVTFSLQGFMLAFRATAEKIVPINQTQTTQTQTQAPAANTNTQNCGSIQSETQRDACFRSRGECASIMSETQRNACFSAQAIQQGGTQDGRGQPAAGNKTPGAACSPDGTNYNGRWDIYGVCQTGGGR